MKTYNTNEFNDKVDNKEITLDNFEYGEHKDSLNNTENSRKSSLSDQEMDE